MKILTRTVAWLLLIFVAGSIFYFSSQPAQKSGEVSVSFVRKILDYIPGVSAMPPKVKDNIAESLDYIARKTAHFTIFASLGFSAAFLAICYEKNTKKFIPYVLLFCLLYAISDEVHQLFVEGRSCRIFDVFIDFFGSTFGVGIFVLIKKLFIFIR